MRIVLVLAITLSALLAFGVACGGDEKEAQVIPSPASESEGETEEWGVGEGAEEEGEGIAEEEEEADAEPEAADEGEPLPADLLDSDDDGFVDVVEITAGSDPLDDASVPESEDTNPGSCTDGVDNDLDGDTDDADDGCPLPGFHVVSANLGVTPREYVGPCPVLFTFSGTITLEVGSGTVSYQFVRSDLSESPTRTLTFDSPGTQDVSWGWSLGTTEYDYSYSGWMAIRILEPEERESNRANFTVTCGE